jgi:RNA polymerase sigma-70 factor (ECF subfamily)
LPELPIHYAIAVFDSLRICQGCCYSTKSLLILYKPVKNFSAKNDQLLMNQIDAGDPAALALLYDRYKTLIFSLAMYITKNQEVAEEITLDVFTQVWEKAGTYRPEKASVRRWLTGITRYRSIDVLRRLTKRANPSSLQWADFSPDSLPADDNPAKALELAQIRHVVRESIAALPAEQKQTLALAYFQGYTHRQIAEILNEPLGTVKTRIRLALQKLCQIFYEKKILE